MRGVLEGADAVMAGAGERVDDGRVPGRPPPGAVPLGDHVTAVGLLVLGQVLLDRDRAVAGRGGPQRDRLGDRPGAGIAPPRQRSAGPSPTGRGAWYGEWPRLP